MEEGQAVGIPVPRRSEPCPYGILRCATGTFRSWMAQLTLCALVSLLSGALSPGGLLDNSSASISTDRLWLPKQMAAQHSITEAFKSNVEGSALRMSVS